MLDKLSFEIKEAPVRFYDEFGNLLQSHSSKVLYRSDDNRELSVMKNSYHPMFTEHFMETTERMRQISGFDFSGYSEVKGGVVILSHLKNNLEDVKIGDGLIKDYLLLGSSCDGRWPFFIGTTTELIRCQNQFSRITKTEKVRHTASAPKKIDELLRSLEVYFKGRRQMYENFERMLEYKVDDKIKEDAMLYILKLEREEMLDGNISNQKLKQAETLMLAMDREISDVGQNLWGIFNGGTYYSTHEVQQKEAIFGNVFGNAADINKRTYDFAMSLLS